MPEINPGKKFTLATDPFPFERLGYTADRIPERMKGIKVPKYILLIS